MPPPCRNPSGSGCGSIPVRHSWRLGPAHESTAHRAVDCPACGSAVLFESLRVLNKKKTPCQQTRSFAFYGPGGIRTLDLSDANRTLSRTRHNASTEHLEGNGCVLFKTGTGCVLFDIFHRTVRTSAPILNKQELSITPSLRQPSEKYSANRWKSLGTSVNTTHSDERSERQGTR